MCADRRLDRDPEAGFTLLEALVAMMVLTLLAAALLRCVVGIRSDAAWFDTHTTSMVVATAVLDEAQADRHLRNGVVHGRWDGRPYILTASSLDLDAPMSPSRWDPGLAVSPMSDDASAQKAAPPAVVWHPQRLTVSVASPNRAVTLEAIHLVAVP